MNVSTRPENAAMGIQSGKIAKRLDGGDDTKLRSFSGTACRRKILQGFPRTAAKIIIPIR